MKQLPKVLFLPNYQPPKDVEKLAMGVKRRVKDEPILWFKVGKMVMGVTRWQAAASGWIVF